MRMGDARSLVYQAINAGPIDIRAQGAYRARIPRMTRRRATSAPRLALFVALDPALDPNRTVSMNRSHEAPNWRTSLTGKGISILLARNRSTIA